MRSPHYQPRHVHVAFALGIIGMGAWSAPAPAQERERGRASRAEYEGWRQYMVNCARCHGDDAVAGTMAPDLRASIAKGIVDRARFDSVVSLGRATKGMPAFNDVLSEEQIAATWAYVSARAKGSLPAGRPRTAPSSPPRPPR